MTWPDEACAAPAELVLDVPPDEVLLDMEPEALGLVALGLLALGLVALGLLALGELGESVRGDVEGTVLVP